MTKAELKEKCSQCGIALSRNKIGEAGFVKYNIRRLHNKLYYENQQNSRLRVGGDWATRYRQ